MAEPTSPTPPTPAPPAPASGRAVRAFLAGDRTPMWFTLFALFAGAMGTYFIAPQVNAQFEAQKIKTDFVIRNYNDLRLKMEDFSALYTTATQKQIAGDSLQQEFEKLQQMTARISAQNTALLPMFVKESGPRSIAEVHQALNGLLQVLIDNAGKDLTSPQASQAYTASVLAAQQRLTRPLLELYVRIAEIGQLNPTEANAELAGD